MKRRALLLSLCAALALLAPAVYAAEIPMYIGTYTKPGETQGIYLARFNTETGAISKPELVYSGEGTSFQVQHPTKKILYTVNQWRTSVSALAIGSDGKLTEINRQPSLGAGPTHLAIDRDGQNLLVANYAGGSIACLPIATDGSLQPARGFVQQKGQGTEPKRQEAPHAHSVYLDAANSHVYSCDLGLDKVFIFRFKPEDGSLEPADPAFASVPPGSGSRHLAFSAKDEFIYVVNELSSTVTAFAREEGKAVLKELQTITTLPADFKGNNNPSEIWVHPNNKFLYASNRGLDSIVSYEMAADGRLRFLALTRTSGEHPRYFRFDPTGQFIISGNMFSHTIDVFKVDATTGALSKVGEPLACPEPSCFLFPKWAAP